MTRRCLRLRIKWKIADDGRLEELYAPLLPRWLGRPASVNDSPPDSEQNISTLVDLLCDRAVGPRATRGFTFFRGDDAKDEWLRYGDLHRASQRIAGALADASGSIEIDRRNGRPAAVAERAIVLCRPGPSYLRALFGTLYSGLVAVTAYPPRARRRDERLDRVVADSQAKFALADQTVYERRQQIVESSPSLGGLTWVNVDAVSSDGGPRWSRPALRSDDLAILQYTSGSTSAPKGVCLTHGNLLSNLRMIHDLFEVTRWQDRWSVSWLPPYHDMGLIGGLLQVLYTGTCAHVIPPASFIQKPIRWLRAISKYQASVSGGPNFAYDACVDRIPESERQSLDLSCWTLAFTGAEPIRSKSLDRFAEAFARNGFRRTSFFPCYGLAEATLIVSGGPRNREPKVHAATEGADGLSAFPGSGIVSCGPVAHGVDLRIVDPKTRSPVPHGVIGEIWVAGRSVSSGYWGQDDLTDAAFTGRIEGESNAYLRTGDLGYLDDGELHITGRSKELIVIRGRNFRPSDIEEAASECNTSLVPNACATFEVETDAEVGLVIVHEVERSARDRAVELVHQIRRRIVETFDLEPHRILLIPKRSLPKTSSGKVQRLQTKRRYQQGRIEMMAVAAWPTRCEHIDTRQVDDHGAMRRERLEPTALAAGLESDANQPLGPEPSTCGSPAKAFSSALPKKADEISAWLAERLAEHLQVDVTAIDIARPFVGYGLDSVSAVQIASDLEKFIGRDLPATMLYDAPTITAVAAKLAAQTDSASELHDAAGGNRDDTIERPREVAIIGIACRMPGCHGVEEFWQLLRSGGTAIGDPPAGREDCVSPQVTSPRAGWIEDPDLFDAALFGISPREACCIDPQHRMLLETSWRAIEDAGIDPGRLSGTRTAVFVGISNRDYERRILSHEAELSTYSMTGNAASMAAHRLSYHLDLRGPSLAVDTACSSSLVALHQAVRSIQSGDCDAAVVAGVNLILSPEVSETLSDAQMLAADGMCKTFDAAADGYVRGEGCVAILIKPLADAVRDGDPVRAVIRGSAINQDGLTNGITAPNVDSQRQLYLDAIRNGALSPSDVTLIEAHGTGTALGDPIEVRSLVEVYAAGSGSGPPCHLGAVKANVGHLEAAAGLASLLKVVLQLQHRETVPQPNLKVISPHIDLSCSRISIPTERTRWTDPPPRLAAVSSFGFGGTNAHVILSENLVAATTPEPSPSQKLASPCLIPLSAASAETLHRVASAHASFIDDHPGVDLRAVASATAAQKTSHRHRVAVVGASAESIRRGLDRFAAGVHAAGTFQGIAPTDRSLSVAFLFSGQGNQYVGMGRGLYRKSPTFREWTERCDALLHDEFGYRVGDVLVSDPKTNGAVAGILEGPGSQTSLFVLQLALAKTLMSWGIRSTAVLGHSMGEYAAAVVSEVMPWEDALRLTAIRAQSIAELDTQGAMTVVFASVESVQQHLRDLDEQLSVAAIDGPDHVVVSGPVTGIESLQRVLRRCGTETRSLRITQGFHSQLIEPVLEAIGKAVSRFSLCPPNQTYVSTLTGSIVSKQLQSADYWKRHSREPVQFVAALETLGSQQCDVAVEIGPHPTLCTLGQLNRQVDLNYRPTLVRGSEDWQSILESLAELFARGAEIDWRQLETPGAGSPRVILPGYPFDRKRFWIEETGRPGARNQPRASSSTVTTKHVVSRILLDRQAASASTSHPAETASPEKLGQYARAMPHLDQIVIQFMKTALSQLGVGSRPGEAIIPEEIISQGRVDVKHGRLLTRICEMIEQEGHLKRSTGRGGEDASKTWAVVEPLPVDDGELARRAAELERQFPLARYELRLATRCGQALPDILSGKTDPLGVLFPGGDATDLLNLYRDSPIAQCCNQLVAEAAGTAIELLLQQPSRDSRPLRVLEIGAGTGGTTSIVLPAIKDRIGSYLLTDISPLLVADAADRLGDSCIEYRVLDIESPANQQGFDPQTFDLVIAANVLHATRNLRESVTHVRQLLRPGGFMIALEGVRREPFLDLVFGLTEGWWRFDDVDLRPSYPLISEPQWIALLKQCGLADVTGLPFPAGQERARECQTVLLARADPLPRRQAKGESQHSAGVSPPAASSRSASLRGSGPSPQALQWIQAFHQGSPDDRRRALEGYFCESVAAVLGHQPDQLDLDQPVNNLGIDSLMAIQLKNRFETDLGLSIPMVAFLQGKTIRQLIDVAFDARDHNALPTAGDQPTTDQRPGESPSSLSHPLSETSRPATSNSDSDGRIDSTVAATTPERILGPMSVGQQALWMIHQRAPRGPAYNFAFAARASRTIDHEAMTQACRSLVKRHPVLRTRYRLDRDAPVRVLATSTEVTIDQKDCRDWKEDRILGWIRQQADRPFDLQHGPVIRFSLLRCKSGDVLSIAMHHIAADLWSMDVLIQELIDLYAMIVGGGSIELGPLPTTYDAYVQWEQELDDSQEGSRLWEFWREKLDGAPHVLALPSTYSRPPEQTYNGRSLTWTISPEVVDGLREIAHAERTTMFTIVLAAYQAFLSRICNQQDLLVGTVSASRGRSDWEGIVGYFLNQLVLRTRIVGSPTFRDLLRDSQREVLDALENQAFPFARLVEKIRPARDASRSPLIQTMFIWDKPRHLSESHFAPGKSSDRLRLKPLLMEQRGAPFDLTLIVFELEEELRLTFRYNTALFSPDAMETLSESLQKLIEVFASDPDTPINATPLLPADQEELIASWNSTDTDFDPKMSGYALFRRWVAQTPDAVAIESAADTLTYREAEARASSIATQLRSHTVGRGDVVGLMMERGVDAIAAILGIWKVGAAYLPLDPDHPAARLQSICDDAAPSVVLTSCPAEQRPSLRLRCPIIDMDRIGDRQIQALADPSPLEIDPDLPAYVIYTSGSTGRPKGVVLAHRGVANLAVAQKETFGIVPDDRCLQFASLSFDASVFEIMMAFHTGATLCVFDSSVIRSTTTQISKDLRRRRISVATLPPSVLAAIPADDLPDLHTVIAAGEACSAAVVKKWCDGRRVFNAYGPTEATVWATTEQCRVDGKDPLLGRPIANVRAFVVDSHLEPTPLGVPGELCLSGPGLAIEYKHLPDITSDVFVPNPFDDRFDATMYRTGDRARWTHEGKLEFLGRIDDQVKIDGHRIEPGEIAAVIRQMKGIENAFVTTTDNGASPQLVAYLVPDDTRASDPQTQSPSVAVRRHVASHLPCYMVPTHVIQVRQLPLTVNGKVDTSKLPRPKSTDPVAEADATQPTTRTEAELAEIWRDVLQLDAVGIHDNFFDLGGASLQALQAADQARQRGYTVSAERMFQFQTIAELAGQIDAATEPTAVAAGPESDTDQPVLPEAGGPGSPHKSCSSAPADRPSGQRRSGSVSPDNADSYVAGVARLQTIGLRPPNSCESGYEKSATALPSGPAGELRMLVESIGMYLPPNTVSTREVIQGCRNRLDFPLEKMTGIASRHVAGRQEFSIDLARKAALNCLQHSRFDARDIDLLIAANISRYDGPNFEVSYEPSTASKLKQQIGADSAVAFDVCNACAGFFTALAVAQARLLCGESRRAMIVSGEYITHLTKTAQLEIDGFLDPRLACLTLGDAGVAVIVELADDGFGFETLELYTAGRHHELCVAKATDQPHGGAIMLTDAIKASAVTLDHSVHHAHRVLESHQWSPTDVQHLIMHQTSSTTLDGAIDELNRHFGKRVSSRKNTVNNLVNRGNTASTTHWVAVMDLIRQGRIRSGDKTVFAISGSGQTIGTALYKFDNLAERVSRHTQATGVTRSIEVPRPKTFGVRIVGTAVHRPSSPANTPPRYCDCFVVETAARAADSCLQAAGWKPNDVQLLIHTGVYRDDFLSEPAVAAILAGQLKINDDRPEASNRRTLAFDLNDASRGTLTACSIIASMIRAGHIERGLITASEVENNLDTEPRRGVAEIGSAIAVEAADDPERGMGEFFFRSYPQFAPSLSTSTTFREGRTSLIIRRSDDLDQILVRCVCDGVSKFLAMHQTDIACYDRVLLSVPSTIDRSAVARLLGVPADRILVPSAAKGDAFTSALALLWSSLAEADTMQSGARSLVVAAGAGIEIACAEYQH